MPNTLPVIPANLNAAIERHPDYKVFAVSKKTSAQDEHALSRATFRAAVAYMHQSHHTTPFEATMVKNEPSWKFKDYLAREVFAYVHPGEAFDADEVRGQMLDAYFLLADEGFYSEQVINDSRRIIDGGGKPKKRRNRVPAAAPRG